MIDWQDWVDRWDKQQERYIPTRELRFELMFDLIESYIGPEFMALDLGCGPGSLSSRMVERFPVSEVLAIDVDPILLKMAEETLGGHDNITLLNKDLRDPDWLDLVPTERVNVVVSSTALHWLPPGDLGALYYQLGSVINSPGIFLNAEGIDFPKSYTKIKETISGVKEIRQQRSSDEVAGESWDTYWDRLKEELTNHGMDELVERRHQIFHWRDHSEYSSPSFDTQQRILLDAGFEEVDSAWQDLKNRVLLAIK